MTISVFWLYFCYTLPFWLSLIAIAFIVGRYHPLESEMKERLHDRQRQMDSRLNQKQDLLQDQLFKALRALETLKEVQIKIGGLGQ